MARTKLYAGIYVVLFVLATVQALVEGVESIDYWTAFGIIIVLSLRRPSSSPPTTSTCAGNRGRSRT